MVGFPVSRFALLVAASGDGLVKGLFWGAVASGPAAVGLWLLAGLSPATVEAVYSRGVYPAVMGVFSRLTGAVPFALAPWLVLAAAIGLVSLFFFHSPLRALSFAGAGLSVVAAWFVLGWGLNYQRLSWAESHGRAAPGGTVAALEALAGRLVDRVNELRPEAFRGGVPEWTGPAVRQAVTRAYGRAAQTDPLLAGRWGDPKAFPFSDAMSWTGIAGVFFPFTGEPLVNAGPANWQLPFTATHEAAHLRGWAREDEANFLGFWVLRNDPDPALSYSAWGSALLYVATALSDTPEGTEAWSGLARRLAPEVKADWNQSFAYWEKFRGPLRQAAQAVNDAYLKAQGQADGVKSYGRMVDLLLAWEDEF